MILKIRFLIFLLKLVFLCQGFIKFFKLVCLLNHTNNMAATLLLMLSKK